MLNILEKKILLFVLHVPRSKNDIINHLNRKRLFRKYTARDLAEAFYSLECAYIIEELGEKELQSFRNGIFFSGVVSDFCGFYVATDEIGVPLGDSILQESRRFIVPLVFSIVLSLLSLSVSILSLLQSLA